MSRNPRNRAPVSTADLVPQVLEEVGLAEASRGMRLLRIWDAALGDFAAHCRPDGLRRGLIEARVRDSAWMQRIQLEKPRILARIHELLGPDTDPLDLRLKIGSLDD
jgi:predicted nucleic acid-binding Zn ribbon protein